MTTTRAYAVLDVKTVDEQTRTIKGIASTPATDRMEDVVEPLGAKFKIPMPLLWQHDTMSPVGTVTYAEKSADGIPFEAEIAQVDGPPQLKARLDEAWASLKAGLVRGVSIGFRALEREPIKGTDGIRFKSWEWLELSLVTIPANAEATVTSIKTFDTEQRAALRGRASLPVTHAGATATKPEGKRMNLKEQIAQFEATRAAKDAARAAIMAKAADEGRTLDETEGEEHDALSTEIESIDKHLARLRAQDKQNRAAALPINAPAKDESGSGSGVEVREGASIIMLKRKLPAGRLFTRVCMAMMAGKGNQADAVQYAKQWADTPEVAGVVALPASLYQKAAVAPGTTVDPTWAGPLVNYQIMASEFVELLRPATVVGRIPGLRNVPFNVKIPAQTLGSTVGWVGEGKPKPVSKMAFSLLQMGETKVAGIVVITDELARFSAPSAEALVQSDLIAAIAQFIDMQFLDPAVAPLAGVHPGSITNGIAGIPASGTSDLALRRDVLTLFQSFAKANLGVAGAVWIMPETALIALAMMVNVAGQPMYPSLNTPNPTLFGLPVIASQVVPGTTSPVGDMIVLCRASDILIADDGGVTIDVSREASLQMDTAPDDPTTAATVLVSLYQNNLVGIRAERYINWQRRRDQAVAWISGAAYVPDYPTVNTIVETPPAQEPAQASRSSKS
jgi:HK97 family phage major capsid protein/HK97 family phage prohead protease